MLFGKAIGANRHTNTQEHKKQAKRDERKRGEEKEKVFKNRFRSGGEENERQIANNVMQGIRVCDGYLVCLDLCADLYGNDARNRRVVERSNLDLTWRKPSQQRCQKSFLLPLEHALVFP